MSSGVLEPAVWRDGIHDERARILSALADRLELLIDGAVEAMRAEIPAYADCDARIYADVREQVRLHYGAKLDCLRRNRELRLEDIAFTRGAAMRRSRGGFALEDYLNAFRVGQRVFWEAVLAVAGETPGGQRAALELAGPLMRYCDFASTHAARVYVELQEHMATDSAQQRGEVLEHLLAGRMPPSGPLHAVATAHGIGPDAPMLVVVAVPVGRAADADAPQAGAAVARAGLAGTPTLVVTGASEIVAVATLGPGCDAERACDQLVAVQSRLRREGMPLAVGISTVAAGPAELPRAHEDARAALQCVAEAGGVLALPRLSALDYLALRAETTARRLIDPRLRAFLRDDKARGGTQRDTIRALAESDLKLGLAAERLQVHPNTAQYRLRRIAERTGRNPRRVADLLELLVAISLEDGIAVSA